jgi:predicted NBD/HSP70 family sugar kinase
VRESVLNTPAAMRRQNTMTVLQAVRRDGPLTRSDVARRTGLSKPTVSEIVASLLSQGYLRESEEGSGKQERTGPRASLLQFAADLGAVLAIDLSIYKVTAVVADLDGTVRATQRLTLKAKHQASADAFVRSVDETVEAALRDAGVSRDRLWFAAIGIPGTLDRDSGTIKLAPTLARWGRQPLGRMLQDLFSCPVLIENEVHLSVLAEQRWGGALDVTDAVYFHAGIGLALGLLVHGQIYRGSDGIAGEIGYMLGSSDEDADAADFGAFEWSAGGLAFARLARRAVEKGRGAGMLALAGGRPEKIDAKLVFQAARSGDSAASAVIATVVDRLAIGVANLCCILNPAVVILGAGLSQAGDDLLEPLRARVAALSPMPPRRFVISKLGARAVTLGAIEHALRAAEAARFNLFPDDNGPATRPEAALA